MAVPGGAGGPRCPATPPSGRGARRQALTAVWHGGGVTSEPRQARFESVAAEVVEPLRRFLARRTDTATADDVLADTLLVCWRRIDEVPDEALPWAYGVARLCLANAERSARRQRRVSERLGAQPVSEPGEHDALHEALARLPAADAELLRLWAWERLGPAEIAVVLDVSPNAAGLRLHRAREKLRDELRKIGLGAGHEGSTEGRTT